jgi:hypothetical protein
MVPQSVIDFDLHTRRTILTSKKFFEFLNNFKSGIKLYGIQYIRL